MDQILSTVSHAHNVTPISKLLGFFLELLQPSYEDDRVASGALTGHALSPSERSFLLQLLTPQTFRDLIKKSPVSLSNTDNILPVDSSSIIQMLAEMTENISFKNKVGISTVISDPDTSLSRLSYINQFN